MRLVAVATKRIFYKIYILYQYSHFYIVALSGLILIQYKNNKSFLKKDCLQIKKCIQLHCKCINMHRLMNTKFQRQVAIREIVQTNQVTSQEQLLNMLKDKGYDLTQATLSRDLKSLKMVKAPTAAGEYVYVLPQAQEKVQEDVNAGGVNFLSEGLTSVDVSRNIAVLKTRPAYASSIAAIIDNATPFEVLGTIAGDDTIFCVLRDGVGLADIVSVLETVMPRIKGRLVY